MKWEFKQSASENAVDLYIYDNVKADTYSWFDGEKKSETSATTFRDKLNEHSNAAQINVYINSRGGDVFEGTAIANQLRRHNAHITAYIDGFACSIASVIACACDKVIMYSNTMMMIHNIACGMWGNSRELRKMADDLDVMGESNRQIYLDKSGGKLTEEKLIEMLDSETWLTAKQCLEFGFCDEIDAQEKDMTEAKKALDAENKTVEQYIAFRKLQVQQFREFSESLRENLPPLHKPLTAKIAEAFLNFKEE